MTPVLRAAVVGGGFGQHALIPALRCDARVSVELVCVSTEARARQLADRLGIPRATGDWRTAVADPAIEVVAISVPPALQPEIAIAAARAGKHVLAEKPMAMTTQQASAMADAVRAAGLVGAVDFEFRELAAWQRARQLLADGAIGRVRHVYVSWFVETLAHRDPRNTWKRDRAAGGGTLNLFVSHSVDSIAWMLGPIARVAARLGAPAPGAAESRVDAWLELADGTPVSLAVAADATAANEHRVEIFGDDGALIVENRGGDYAAGFSLALGRRGAPWTPVELPPIEASVDGRIVAVAGVVRKFLDAVIEHRPMTPSFDDGVAAQRAIDAIREAHRTGTWQRLS